MSSRSSASEVLPLERQRRAVDAHVVIEGWQELDCGAQAVMGPIGERYAPSEREAESGFGVGRASGEEGIFPIERKPRTPAHEDDVCWPVLHDASVHPTHPLVPTLEIGRAGRPEEKSHVRGQE